MLDKWIPTTKWCPKCRSLKKDIQLSDREYICSCGYSEDRDIHSAQNMLAIKNLVFSKLNLVPTEHREITLTEFETSTGDASVEGESERGSEKITPFKA